MNGQQRRKAKIGVVIGAFYQDITTKIDNLVQNYLQTNPDLEIVIYKVPGAVEIPLVTKKLALKDDIHAVIMIGVIIRGDTSHYDYVCQQVSFGCQSIALDLLKPIIFGVLTCENEQQVHDRLGGKAGNKVTEAFDTALHMIELCKSLS